MGRALGSWITATGLKKINAEVLRDALLTDKEKFARAGIEIPLDLESKGLDYPRLADYFHGEHDSQVLEEALFCAIKLDSEEGWDIVQAEIHKSGIPYAEPQGRCIGNACHCLLAWLMLKDSLPYLLETSYGKIQTTSPFTMHLFPLNSRFSEHHFRKPDAKSLKDAEAALAEHYGAATGKAWCRILHFDCYDDEVWFMIRYPGRIECIITTRRTEQIDTGMVQLALLARLEERTVHGRCKTLARRGYILGVSFKANRLPA